MGRLMGIDYGRKRIGVATTEMMAFGASELVTRISDTPGLKYSQPVSV